MLYDTLPDQTENAIDNFGELAELFGPHLTHEATTALVRFWRTRQPTLVSSRKPNARNQIDQFDCIGIAGVSLEAKSDPDWAKHLSATEAVTAAELATLELNGFPSWTASLAAAWQEQVRDVFLKEAQDHLATDASQHGFIDKVAYAEPALAALLAPAMIQHIASQPSISGKALAKALEILARALPITSLPAEFVETALARFISSENDSDAALYLGIALQAEPTAAVEALIRKLDALDFPAQKRLVEHVLPSVFGDRMFRTGIDPKLLPFPVLERLVGIAFKTIRHEDDNVHPGVYSPDQRDDAESARGHLFHQLRMAPGRPTVDALKRLKEDASCPIPADRLADMILERASEDAEHAPWPASEARAMEEEFDTQPRTPRDLQLVALRRIADMDHDLHHHQFAQGQTVKALPNEREVQKWIAHELNHRKGRAYTITREPHVVEEKEPDIRCQSNATDANMPIEIKVAESWTLPELLDALTTQLTSRYLRERDKRHGILLLIHQHVRLKGWQEEAGVYRSFDEVVAVLRAEAKRLLSSGIETTVAEIAVINVSDLRPAVQRNNSLSGADEAETPR